MLMLSEFDRAAGAARETAVNLNAVQNVIASANRLGKVERLLWVTAQARKIHSSICNNAFWCVKESGEFKARGADPLACKACCGTIRSVCPAYLEISNALISFNNSGEETFNLSTSGSDNIIQGQKIIACTGPGGVLADEDTPTYASSSFIVPYPTQRSI